MTSLAIHLFGGVRVLLDGEPLGPFPTRWSAGLLGYLALHRQRLFHRDILAALFWPEEPDARARKALRNALWRVRAMIEPSHVEPERFLVVEGQSVGLRSGPDIWVDVEEFEEHTRSADAGPFDRRAAGRLERALDLWRGELMDGHDHQWCVYERQRLRLRLLAAQERLLDFHMGRGAWQAALRQGDAILHLDPFREHVYRHLMLCHHSMGDRPLAVRRFQRCRELLAEELGIAPMEETRTLYDQIRSGDVPHGEVAIRSMDSRVGRALRRAEAALTEIRALTARDGAMEHT